MSNEQSSQALRLTLTKMLQISQRTVDYATKAYTWGHPDFVYQAGREREELDHLSQKILVIVRSLRDKERVDIKQLRSNEAIRLISKFLSSLCFHAYKMSFQAAIASNHSTNRKSQKLIWMSERLNCSMRLCVLAFIDREIKYAETILLHASEWEHRSTGAIWHQDCSSSEMPADDLQERPIMENLHQMMRNVYAIALELYSGELLFSIDSLESQCASCCCGY